MPRKRGGARTGSPSGSYGNRRDLQQHQGTIPQRVASGQTYGKAQQQQQAMRTVPMAPQPTLIPPNTPAPPAGTFGPGGGATPPPGSPSPGGGGLASLLQLSGGPNSPAPQGQPSAHPALPDSPLPPLDRPSERPNEPVTAGAATGPGPGTSALPSGPVAAGGTSLSTMLSAIAQQSNSRTVQALAQRATGAGL
jgi:hypothetical protein